MHLDVNAFRRTFQRAVILAVLDFAGSDAAVDPGRAAFMGTGERGIAHRTCGVTDGNRRRMAMKILVIGAFRELTIQDIRHRNLHIHPSLPLKSLGYSAVNNFASFLDPAHANRNRIPAPLTPFAA